MPTRDIVSVMNDHAAHLMAIPGVVIVAIGQLSDGTPCIQVYAHEITPELRTRIGATLEGYPVDFLVSDEVRPLD
jgi:hypothetical protein